jgi:hypothetical protein
VSTSEGKTSNTKTNVNGVRKRLDSKARMVLSMEVLVFGVFDEHRTKEEFEEGVRPGFFSKILSRSRVDLLIHRDRIIRKEDLSSHSELGEGCI